MLLVGTVWHMWMGDASAQSSSSSACTAFLSCRAAFYLCYLMVLHIPGVLTGCPLYGVSS
jgi:uncharacterized MAPEG superfamily protein